MVWSLHIDLGVFIDVEGSTKARCFPACGNAVVYLSRTQEPFFFFLTDLSLEICLKTALSHTSSRSGGKESRGFSISDKLCERSVDC